jgi:DNA-binding response OmpR family regulator
MTKARILWIEGRRAESPSFIPHIRKKGYLVESVLTGKAALSRLADFDPHVVVLNSASMRTSGKRICNSLRDRIDGLPIVVIASKDQVDPQSINANVVLELPFTSRKLLNRIVPLLPSKKEDVIKAGPIRVDVERNHVRCQGQEASLTPRLTELLLVLMDNRGQVVEREDLFREVWRTEYTGDTRTLDVHISWLRQALEKDPRKPRLLKTIRGVGYRLDV